MARGSSIGDDARPRRGQERGDSCGCVRWAWIEKAAAKQSRIPQVLRTLRSTTYVRTDIEQASNVPCAVWILHPTLPQSRDRMGQKEEQNDGRGIGWHKGKLRKTRSRMGTGQFGDI